MKRSKKRPLKRKDDRVRLSPIRLVPLAKIYPATENSALYRPVRANDPEIIELADDIRKNGVLVPLVITGDGLILSGHRRRLAAHLAGLTEASCQIADVKSDDPRLAQLLVSFNQQRVKSWDEFLHEAIVNANPDDPYESLIDRRLERAEIEHDLEKIELRERKERKQISRAKYPMLKAVIDVLNANREWWPLSDRQIHYRLLNDPPLTHASKPRSRYRNNKLSYRMLTDLLTRARLEGAIPWEAIDDPTRPVTIWNVHRSPQPFIKEQIEDFLKGYWRDLLQSQPNHIEVLGEKLTVQGIIRPICMKYGFPFTIGRGYSSIEPRRKLVERFRASGKEKLVLLVLSDFDPSGEEIAHSFARSLRDDFDLAEREIEAIKVALTLSQVEELELPPIMSAKETDPNYDRFVENYGEIAHELEAVEPNQLQEILTDAIDAVIDTSAFNAELDAERRDRRTLDGVRKTVREFMKTLEF
jgi:hypothetical protein